MIKVIIKGDSEGDYVVYASEGLKARIHDTEMLNLLDVNGAVIYEIPFSRIRLMEDVNDPTIEVPVFNREKCLINVVIEGPMNRDISKVCQRVSTNRFFTSMTIEGFNFLGLKDGTSEEMWERTFLTALDNIVMISHIHNIDAEELNEKPQVERPADNKAKPKIYQKK